MRENLRSVSLVTARLEDRDLAPPSPRLGEARSQVTLPVGYAIEIGGQYIAAPAFSELLLVLGVAAALVLCSGLRSSARFCRRC